VNTDIVPNIHFYCKYWLYSIFILQRQLKTLELSRFVYIVET